MTTEFKFIQKQKEAIFQYHLPTNPEGFFKENLFSQVYKYPEEYRDDIIDKLASYSIHYEGIEEDSFLYTQLLRQLYLESPQPLLCILFGDHSFFSEIGTIYNFQKIEWRYSIEYLLGDDCCRDFGFLNPKAFLEEVNYYNKSLANRYFYLAEIDARYFNHFIHHFQADVSNWVFIATDQPHEIRSMLAASKPPNINEYFEALDWQVNLQIGEDEGYLDYILLQSKRDLSGLLASYERKAKRFIRDLDRYLGTAKKHYQLENWDSFCQNIQDLIQLHFPT
jgi:hypothetical protein